MSKKYGIARARDVSGAYFGRASIEREPQPFTRPLTCAGRGCTAMVVAVIGHHQRGQWVEPLYRLHGHAEHSPGCPYDIDAQLRAIGTDHRAVVDEQAGIYRLRLTNAERPTPVQQLIQQRDVPANPRTPAGIHSDPSHTTSAVLAAARDIASLVQRSGHDPDLRAIFRVVYSGGELSWDEFCWPAHRIDELAADLKDHPKRPRAVYGPAHLPVEETHSDHPTAAIRLDTTPSSSRLNLRIRLDDMALATRLVRPAGAVVLALGAKWAAFPFTPRAAAEIRMWITDRSQVTSWPSS